jgi:hypothetical protein
VTKDVGRKGGLRAGHGAHPPLPLAYPNRF